MHYAEHPLGAGHSRCTAFASDSRRHIKCFHRFSLRLGRCRRFGILLGRGPHLNECSDLSSFHRSSRRPRVTISPDIRRLLLPHCNVHRLRTALTVQTN